MKYAVLTGTTNGKLPVSFQSGIHYEVSEIIAEEFGFKLVPIPKAELGYKGFEYPGDFWAFCYHERHVLMGGFDNG